MGCVYILENPAMPELIKIGYTTRTAEERAKELYEGITGVPTPFIVSHIENCEEPRKLESAVHKELSNYRINNHREFFKYPAADAYQLLLDLHRYQNMSWWRRWTSHFLTRFKTKVEIRTRSQEFISSEAQAQLPAPAQTQLPDQAQAQISTETQRQLPPQTSGRRLSEMQDQRVPGSRENVLAKTE